MSMDTIFETETMADVWRKQGRYAEAIRIYAILLEKEPARSDLAEKLAATRSEYGRLDPVDLRTGRILQQWIEILLRFKRQTDIRAVRPD